MSISQVDNDPLMQRMALEGPKKQEQGLASFLRSAGRHMAPEDETRLKELTEELALLLRRAQDMSSSDRRRVREIEREIEKLTGMRLPGKISLGAAIDTMDATDGNKDDAQEQAGGLVRSDFLRAGQLGRLGPAQGGQEPGEGVLSFARRSALAAYAAAALGDKET